MLWRAGGEMSEASGVCSDGEAGNLYVIGTIGKAGKSAEAGAFGDFMKIGKVDEISKIGAFANIGKAGNMSGAGAFAKFCKTCWMGVLGWLSTSNKISEISTLDKLGGFCRLGRFTKISKITLSSIIGVFCAIFLLGCGYVPSATYAQKALGERVYVKLNVNLPNPENSVELKDLLNKNIIARFQTRVGNEEEADSIIIIDINKITDTTFAVSSSAFTTYYRVTTYVTYTYDNKKGSRRTFSGSGYFDYNVSLESPLTTYNNRYYAINQAFGQTMDSFVAQLSFEGQK